MKKKISIVMIALMLFNILIPNVFNIITFAEPSDETISIDYDQPNKISDIFPDSNLAKTVSDWMGLTVDDEITRADIIAQNPDFLFINNKNISDLQGMQIFETTSLSRLFAQDNNIVDLSPLSNLTNLISLRLDNNTNLSSIEPLQNLINLEALFLDYNDKITDLSPMQNMTSLKSFYFNSNKLSDISVLSNLIELTNLDISGNYFGHTSDISDITPLQNLNLKTLKIGSQKIKDISPIANMSSLEELSMQFNLIDTIPNQTWINMKDLDLSNNPISDISTLINMPNLNNIKMSQCKITDVTPLSELTSLTSINLGYNFITDISPLEPLMDNLFSLLIIGNFIDNIYTEPIKTSLKSIISYNNEHQWLYRFYEPDTYGSYPSDTVTLEIGVGEEIALPFSGYRTINGIDFTPNPSTTNMIQDYINKHGDVAEFNSINSDIVTVLPNNNIIGVSEGTTTIKAVALGLDSNYTTATLNVIVSSNITGSITVNHKDDSGNILDTEVFNDLALENHTVSAKSFTGYTLNGSSSQEVTLTETEPNKTVEFLYNEDIVIVPPVIKGSITVNHKDDSGNILDTEVFNDLALGNYTVNAKSFTGYTLSGSSSQEVILTEAEPNKTVEFLYNKDIVIVPPVVKGSITVNHKDDSGNILDTEVFNDLALGNHTVNAKSFTGYTLSGSSSQEVTLTETGPNKTVEFLYNKNVVIVPPVENEESKPNPPKVEEPIVEAPVEEDKEPIVETPVEEDKEVLQPDPVPEEEPIVEVEDIKGKILGKVYLLEGDKRLNQENIKIKLYNSNNELMLESWTEIDGFKFDNLELGKYYIEAIANDELVGRKAYFITEDFQTVELTKTDNIKNVEFEIKLNEEKEKLPQTGENNKGKMLNILILVLTGSIILISKKKESLVK